MFKLNLGKKWHCYHHVTSAKTLSEFHFLRIISESLAAGGSYKLCKFQDCIDSKLGVQNF